MRSYFSRLHHLEVVALAVLTVAFGVVGWVQRPPSSGFSAVSSGLSLYVKQAPGALAFSETMAPSSDGGSVLTFEGSVGLPFTDTPGAQYPTGSWTFVVNNLGGGRLCTPSRAVVDGAPAHIGRERLVAHPTLGYPTPGLHLTGMTGLTTTENGAMYVQLCWPPGDGPVAENGAYLNAQFPPLFVFAHHEETEVTRQLNVTSSDPADYTVQSLQRPTGTTSGGWQWTSPNGATGSRSSRASSSAWPAARSSH
jgi:hypothetical protein